MLPKLFLYFFLFLPFLFPFFSLLIFFPFSFFTSGSSSPLFIGRRQLPPSSFPFFLFSPSSPISLQLPLPYSSISSFSPLLLQFYPTPPPNSTSPSLHSCNLARPLLLFFSFLFLFLFLFFSTQPSIHLLSFHAQRRQPDGNLTKTLALLRRKPDGDGDSGGRARRG
ncbi:unnamed protein product [Cuscuta europaea]|uniref:Uncharacterized protein n=1 Tax=Cuscuta europaea TaxID=41803 RepID=A0A9P0YKS2_CUSEU|nr:unnamed protein product [Cuscuta europaea]